MAEEAQKAAESKSGPTDNEYVAAFKAMMTVFVALYVIAAIAHPQLTFMTDKSESSKKK